MVREDPTGSDIVSWGEFVELGYLREYRNKGVPLQQLRPVIDKLRERYGTPYPLANHKPFVGPGRKLVMEVERKLGFIGWTFWPASSSGVAVVKGLA